MIKEGYHHVYKVSGMSPSLNRIKMNFYDDEEVMPVSGGPTDSRPSSLASAKIENGDQVSQAEMTAAVEPVCDRPMPLADRKAEAEGTGVLPYNERYPEGGYGYVVIFACILIGACTAGSVSALGVYQAEYAERFPDKSSFEINLVGGFMGFVSVVREGIITIMLSDPTLIGQFMGIGAAVFGRLGDRL
jgi:hypothetical protein